jgi:hypothetical protein
MTSQDIYELGSGTQDTIEVEKGRAVDVFFVIDRSWSMREDFPALHAAIGEFVPKLRAATDSAKVDVRMGLVAHDMSFRWPWLDLTPGVAAFQEKLAGISAGRRNECTALAIDYALEHASWDTTGARHGFLVVMTDEPVEEGGEKCTGQQFEMLLDKIGGRGLATYFVATPWCLREGRLFERLRDWPLTFVSDRLREERGEKLVDWLAKGISRQRYFAVAAPGAPPTKDIFGSFSRVRLV